MHKEGLRMQWLQGRNIVIVKAVSIILPPGWQQQKAW